MCTSSAALCAAGTAESRTPGYAVLFWPKETLKLVPGLVTKRATNIRKVSDGIFNGAAAFSQTPNHTNHQFFFPLTAAPGHCKLVIGDAIRAVIKLHYLCVAPPSLAGLTRS